MKVILITKNKFKADEVVEIINGFGITLEFVDSLSDIDFSQHKDDLFILREETQLENNGDIVEVPDHLDCLTHVSKLTVTKFTNNNKIIKSYTSKVEGFIDKNKRQDNSNSIYNWDDIFVCIKNLKSYFEMKNTFNKFSARTKSISKFLNDYTFFDQKVDLNFNPFKQDNVIEFNDQIYSFIESNEFLKQYKNNHILNGIMTNVLDKGLFTRSSLNKKQRNYWYPSLNAGLPLVPKKDELHETTFMFHDLMHHAIPDLIMTGNDSKNHKETYVIHRMMSEAFTLVLADMIFIDELVKIGVEYDWGKRKIYPVFKSMNIKALTKDKLKDILWANVNFALLGEDELMLSLSSEKPFSEFKNKYEKFFIEDYRWTLSNYDNMIKDKDTISSWFNSNKNLIIEQNTVDYYEALTREEETYRDKIKVIFEKIWSKLEYDIDHPIRYNNKKSTQKAFKNYMIGQSILFFRFDNLKESKIFFELIYRELKQNKTVDIEKIRNLFNLYIDKLVNENKLDDNTAKTYKEVVPLFDAFYVFYDQNLQYKSIKDFLLENIYRQ